MLQKKETIIIDTVIIDDLNRNEYIKRIIDVLGTNNYSLLFRNCEHVSNYIYYNTWCSFQTSYKKGKIFNFFKDYILGKFLNQINTPPENINLNPELIVSNELKTIYKDYVNKITKKLIEENEVVSSLNDIIKSNYNLKYTGYDYSGLKVTKETHCILLAGVTGTGKSRILNVLFKRDLSDSRYSTTSTTRQIMFYYGDMSTSTVLNKKICIIDTIGLCDTQLTNEQILMLVKDKINSVNINKVIFTLGTKYEPAHKEGINRLIHLLNLNQYFDNTFFIVTKCDGLKIKIKDNLVEEYRKHFINFTKSKNVNTITSSLPDINMYDDEYINILKTSITNSYNGIMTIVDVIVEKQIKIYDDEEKEICNII